MSKREDPPVPYSQPCWQLAFSETSGFDPTSNPSNRWWYWRGGRSAFGRFDSDSDGLFFMRGRDPSTSVFRQPQGRKRLRACDATLGDTEVILSDGGN